MDRHLDRVKLLDLSGRDIGLLPIDFSGNVVRICVPDGRHELSLASVPGIEPVIVDVVRDRLAPVTFDPPAGTETSWRSR
ncbi:MAG: hypothetical protein U1E76_21610 [Planctomycetota bacterium]